MCVGCGGLRSRLLGAIVIPLGQITEHKTAGVTQGEAGMTLDITAFFHDGCRAQKLDPHHFP